MTALVALTTLLGLAVGSFLNVVIWRVPRGESLRSPGSHCPACAAPVRWRDNVPVLSWLALRGRCRDCGGRIAGRYPAVELATAALFLLLALRLGTDAALPAYLYLAAVGIALAVIDLDCKRLPDVLTLPAYPVGIALLGLAAMLDGDPGRLLRGVAAMMALFGFYFAIAFVYPAGMGFGDVKLSGLLGLFLGWSGWGAFFVGAFGAFVLGGGTAVVLVLARRAGRASAIPFGPFMLLATLVAVLFGDSIAASYLNLATS